MMLTTISSNPSSIVITGSLFLLTLIMSSFSSLDSRPTIPTPFHSCSFVPLRSNLQPPQLFRFVPLPYLVSYTYNKPIFLVSIISAKLLPFPVTVPIFKLPTLTQQLSTFRIKTTFMATSYSQHQNENREENDFNLFTGSIMDPFKTGPTGLFAMALVPLGKSGRFSLGVVPKPTAIAKRPVFLTQRVSSQWPRFNQLRDGQKLPKNRLWRI